MNIEYINKIMELAEIAYFNDEIPVGAVVVYNSKIIGEGVNTRSNNSTVIGHAEINAIENACKTVGDWRLSECELYVNLKPCMMCTGAIVESRIKKVYYICDRTNVRFNPEEYIELTKINNKEIHDKYMKLLQLFFENKRNKS